MEIHGIGGMSGPERIEVRRVGPQRASELGNNQPVHDRVEISEKARLLNMLAEVPDVRLERVSQLKELIAAGKFETPERVRVAVDRILEDL